MHAFEKNIKDLDIKIPNLSLPVANYVPYKLINNILYISGQAPILNGEIIYKGKVGLDISIEDGIKAAELCCMNILAAVKHATNDNWDNFVEIIKIGGFVNCHHDFSDQPKVINGASDLISNVFGDKGKHTRAAVSANSLPLGAAVEVEGIFEI